MNIIQKLLTIQLLIFTAVAIIKVLSNSINLDVIALINKEHEVKYLINKNDK